MRREECTPTHARIYGHALASFLVSGLLGCVTSPHLIEGRRLEKTDPSQAIAHLAKVREAGGRGATEANEVRARILFALSDESVARGDNAMALAILSELDDADPVVSSRRERAIHEAIEREWTAKVIPLLEKGFLYPALEAAAWIERHVPGDAAAGEDLRAKKRSLEALVESDFSVRFEKGETPGTNLDDESKLEGRRRDLASPKDVELSREDLRRSRGSAELFHRLLRDRYVTASDDDGARVGADRPSSRTSNRARIRELSEQTGQTGQIESPFIGRFAFQRVERCPWFNEFIDRRFTNDPSSPWRISFDLEACEASGGEDIAPEIVLYEDFEWGTRQESEVRSVDVPVSARCDPDHCLSYDPLGVCLERSPPPPDCPAPIRRLETRRIPVADRRPLTRRYTGERRKRRHAISLQGTVRVERSGFSTGTTVHLVDAWQNEVSWSPAHSVVAASPQSIAEDTLYAQLNQTIEEAVRRVRLDRAERAATKVRALLADGKEDEAEAMAFSNFAPDSLKLQELITERYGRIGWELLVQMFDPRNAEVVMPRAPPRLSFPTPSVPDLEVVQPLRPRSRDDEDGAPIFPRHEAFELLFRSSASPLRTADLAHAIELAHRTQGGARMFARAGSSRIGGQAGSFALGIDLLPNDLLWEDESWIWGVSYERQTGPTSETWHGILIPLGYAVRFWRMWVEAKLEINTFQVADLGSRDASDARDTHFWSRLSGNLFFVPHERIVLSGGASLYVGRSSDVSPRFGGAVGFRL